VLGRATEKKTIKKRRERAPKKKRLRKKSFKRVEESSRSSSRKGVNDLRGESLFKEEPGGEGEERRTKTNQME